MKGAIRVKQDYDVNKPVRNLQRALRRLSYKYDTIPVVVPDGTYGAQTTEAVRQFQKLFDLPQTGETTAAVWDKIMEEYEKVLAEFTEAKGLMVFPSPSFTIKVGDENEIIPVVLSVMTGIATRYSNFNIVEVASVFTEDGAAAVKQIQKVSGLPETGIVNKATWDMISAIFEADVSKCRIEPIDTNDSKIIKRDRITYSPYSNDDYRL